MRKLLVLFLFPTLMASAQQELPLYGDQPIPNSKPVPDRQTIDSSGNPIRYSYSLVSRPTLTVYRPAADKANGTAVIVCPGGGYVHLAMTHEGTEICQWLNSLGITAFLLKYRLPSDETMVDKTIGPLQDAQRAIQLVREGAKEWNLKSDAIGILGFSAGGHLVSTAGTHFDRPVIPTVSGVSLRPDFMVLLYPVISFADSIGHRGSRDALLGNQPASGQIQHYSNELQVTDRTPPCFLIHAEDDKTVMVVNSLYFYEALAKHHVPAEMHIYPSGGHGFGMWNPTSAGDQWPNRLAEWMKANGWIH